MKYVYLFGGAIGDSLVGIHLGRSLAERRKGERFVLLSTRRSQFVEDLVAPLAFVEYRELIKSDVRTWWRALLLATSPSSIFVFEPTDVPLPSWWRFILAVATWVPSSKEVHSQLVGHERETGPRVETIMVHPDDNLFLVNIPRILSAWDIEPGAALTPSLPRLSGEENGSPYVVFHFFAGSYRRSLPIEKVRPLLEAARRLYGAHEFVLTASKDERVRAEQMIAGIEKARVASGLPAQELTNLLSGAELVVGVASGVTHISSHLGVPTVALANLSDPYWLPTYAPKTKILANREECRCKGNKEGECFETASGGIVYRCLYYIPTEQILSSMASVLSP